MTHIPDNLKEKLRKITHLILDVDGVLTDGRIIFDDEGRELKFYDVKDGHGIKLLMRAGIEIILLTGRSSNVVDRRARDLQINEIYKGAKNKIEVYESILAAKQLRDEQIACMGDDIVDIKILKRSGFSAAPSDASEHVIKIVDYVTARCAGRGAVRELCEVILQAQGKWEEVIERYSMDAHG